MKINQIKLKNFRQYKDVELYFSGSDEKNITIIRGENGYGKTTLIRAFLWGLYGGKSSGYKAFDTPLLNRDVEKELDLMKEATTSVILELQHLDNLYRITTKVVYKKRANGEIFQVDKPTTTILKQEKDNVSMIPIEDPATVAQTIQSILNNEIKDYFFYDGENNKIEQVAKGRSIKKAVSMMMGIERIEDLNEWFHPNKKASVISYLNDQIKDDSIELNTVNAQRKDAIVDLEKNKSKQNDYLDEIEKLNEQKREKEHQINANEDAKAAKETLDEQRKKLNRIGESAEFNSTTAYDYFRNNDGFLHILYSYLFETKEMNLLSENSNFNKYTSLSHISEEAIDQLIKRGYCLCGCKITNDSEAYRHLIEEKSHMEPHDYGKYINDFIQSEKNNKDYAERTQENIRENIKEYMDKVDDYDTVQENIRSLQRKLEGRIDVGEVQKEYYDLESQIKTKEGALSQLKVQETEFDYKIKNYDKEFEKLSRKNSENKAIIRAIEYAKIIYKSSSERIKNQEKEVKEKLNLRVNELFSQMYHGKRKLRIDDSYNVSSLDGDAILDNSTGTETVKNFAFIGALLEVAREMLNKNNDVYYDENNYAAYPLVMDAPFSNTDEEHIKRICRCLPTICDQLIMVIIDRDYMIAKDSLDGKVGDVYKIVKHSETWDSIEKVN